jgi:hypothetical protein
MRVISSSPAQISRDEKPHPADAAVGVGYTGHQALSHIPRPSTAAAAATSVAKQSDQFPDGRFEFVGASIADGRRKQLARPSTAVSLCLQRVLLRACERAASCLSCRVS